MLVPEHRLLLLLLLVAIIIDGLIRLIGLLILELFEPGVDVPEDGELEAIVDEPELVSI